MQSRSVGWRIAVCAGVAAAAVWGGLACAAVTNPHGIAVIIGNYDYRHTEDVTFAHRDAEAFGRYVVEILGFDPGRVLYLKDAEKIDLEKMFGNQGNNRGVIWRRLDEEGRSDVVVFYSGHGMPGLQDRRGYLVPVNAEPDSAELTGYSLDLLWENLGKLEKARSVAVYVDACFVGESAAGTLFKGTSSVRVHVPLPEEGDGRMTLLTAASGKQVALWDQQAKHGLFTKHLLDGLYGGADANEDGRVTAGEAKAYLDGKMTPAARRVGKEQKAQLKGAEEKVLSAARFPARSSREAKALGADLEKVRKEKEAVEGERTRLARELEQVRKEKEDVSRARQRLARKVAEQEEEMARLRGELAAAKGGVPGRQPGEAFRVCEEEWCPWMVVVPAGEFMMGSGSGEGENDERPRHKVRIGKPFAVGKYEVTFGEWEACVAGGGCKGYQPSDEGWGRGDRPVINVSWEDARAYVRWLSRRTGLTYRLLSEAEWEYVVWAGTKGNYHWGPGIGEGRANCKGCGSEWDMKQTAPVGSFRENGWGLYDGHGNVWEWVEDCWHRDYEGAPRDGRAWTTGGDCSSRVLRGGSWSSKPRNLRSANRFRNSAGNRNNNLGFRIARTLTP